MKLTAEQGIEILFDVVRWNKRHIDYQHTVNLSALYTKLMTGVGVNTLLKKVGLREDEQRYKLRDELTVALTPSWCNAAMSDFYYVGRLDNIKTSISYPKDSINQEARVNEVIEKLSLFYGRESVDKYIANNFVENSFLDPNMFIAVEFKNFNPVVEKATPYPVEWYSENCIDFKYEYNELQYLIVKKNEKEYLMYLPDDVIQLKQIEITNNNTNANYYDNQIINSVWRCDSVRSFAVSSFRPLAGEVQAYRIGYKRDLSKKGRNIYVNPFHAALPYLMKAIKAVSEFDITTTFHAFPQKIQASEPCTGDTKRHQICESGKRRDGKTCEICKGQGSITHKSALDVINVNIPDMSEMIKRGASLPDLSNILVYKNVDTGILEFQNKYIQQLESDFYSSIYNADVKRKKSANTATEIDDANTNRQNAIQPFTDAASGVWKFFTRLTSVFTDNGIPKLIREYPSDLKLQSVSELYAELERANKAEIPGYLKQAIINDIAARKFSDEPDKLKKQLAIQKHVPFIGVSFEQVQFFIASGDVLEEHKVLYLYSDSIFDELQNEVEGFYDSTYLVQKKYVQEKVDSLLAKINTQKQQQTAQTWNQSNMPAND